MNVKLEKSGDWTVARLSGDIDDLADFDKLIGPLPAQLRVDCAEVTRINSTGVKTWMKYFQQSKTSGTQLEFLNLSPVIVEQFNQIRNFGFSGKVLSIQCAFACPACGEAFNRTFSTEDLRKAQFQVSEQPCPKCKSPAAFDDYPSEYFVFLIRN